MNNHALNGLLQEFAAQRRYREQRRKQFLRRFESVRSGIKLDSQPQSNVIQQREQIQVNSPQHDRQVINHIPSDNRVVPASQEEQDLILENEKLSALLAQLEENQKAQMTISKEAIDTAKTKYLGDLTKLIETSKQNKQQMDLKINNMKKQTEAAIKKNNQIDVFNAELKKQEGALDRQDPNFQEIKKEYDDKLSSFQAIFESSNQKIEALEKEFNEEEFIQNTLKNQELLKSIEENAQKAAQASKLLDDYRNLNDGKLEILNEIRANNEMKEKEILKMQELQGKMKVIMQKLTKERESYVNENSRMAGELMQVKQLLMASVGEGQ